MEFPEIHFGGDHPKLHSYKKFYWQPGETRQIEFYPNQIVPVTLLYTSDPTLYDKLSTLIDGKPISIDLEWAQPINHSPHPIELFQFSSSKGTIIVASHENRGYEQIAKFLHSSTFFGKGMSCDKKKLIECLGESFDDIEDIEKTRLQPNGLPINFESLTQMFLGQGTAKFKDHKVQRSDWSVRPLSILQILYGAHDSYAMLQVYRKIIEKYGEEIKVDLTKKSDKDKKKKKDKPKVEKKLECHFVDINGIINDNDNDNIDELLSENPPSYKEQLFNLCVKKGEKVKDEDSCFIEHSNEILPLLLPSQPKEKRNLVLERICLSADLIMRGIISSKGHDKFRCNICFKFLKDPIALIQHSFSRHLKEDENEENPKTNHNLDTKDVLLHFLIANKQVKCPFKVIFDDSELKKLAFEEEEDSDDSDSDSDSDEKDDNSKNIVPLTYNKSDGIKCCLCNSKFDSVELLRNHCWLHHSDLFVGLVTGKGLDKDKEEENKKLHKFGAFCIKHLNVANINSINLSIDCKLCNVNTPAADKFFNHLFFRHQQFALVSKEQCALWPIRYSEFSQQMEKQAKPYAKAFDYDELEKAHVYDRKGNKCVNCNVSFKNDEERDNHYMKNHLIYLPPQSEQ